MLLKMPAFKRTLHLLSALASCLTIVFFQVSNVDVLHYPAVYITFVFFPGLQPLDVFFFPSSNGNETKRLPRRWWQCQTRPVVLQTLAQRDATGRCLQEVPVRRDDGNGNGTSTQFQSHQCRTVRSTTAAALCKKKGPVR